MSASPPIGVTLVISPRPKAVCTTRSPSLKAGASLCAAGAWKVPRCFCWRSAASAPGRGRSCWRGRASSSPPWSRLTPARYMSSAGISSVKREGRFMEVRPKIILCRAQVRQSRSLARVSAT